MDKCVKSPSMLSPHLDSPDISFLLHSVIQASRKFKQGVNKQGTTTLAWRPGGQHHDAATRRADSLLVML